MPGWVYGIRSGQFIKVGWSRNIAQRMREMKLLNPHPIRLVIKHFSDDPVFIERAMHRHLSATAKGREWFLVTVPEVRAALNIAMQELQQHYKEQQEWEIVSAARSEKRRRRPVESAVDRLIATSNTLIFQ